MRELSDHPQVKLIVQNANLSIIHLTTPSYPPYVPPSLATHSDPTHAGLGEAAHQRRHSTTVSQAGARVIFVVFTVRYERLSPSKVLTYRSPPECVSSYRCDAHFHGLST